MSRIFPARGYYAAATSPRSGVGRVTTALRKGLEGLPGLADFTFDYASGGLNLRQGSESLRVARGLKVLKKSAFYLSFKGRVPHSAKGFVDNQTLAFLGLPHCGLFVHDLFLMTHPDNAADRLLGKFLYRNMGDYPFYLANSHYTRDSLCDVFKVPAARVNVVPLDCDRSVFHPREVDRAAFLSKFNLPADRRYILHVSSGEKRKNFHRVLEAFGLISRDFPDTILVRIGRTLHGENRRRETEIAERLGISDRTLHMQDFSDEDLALFYSVADCFAFPSTAEGFGLPLLEAQACGCPCVTSAATALAEIAGPLCVTVDPLDSASIAEGIASVLRDTGRRAEQSAANALFLERFDWRHAQRLLREWMT